MSDKPVRVLVADDHTLFRQCFCDMLAQKGYAIAGEASAVAEILELCCSNAPDLVVLDIQFADGNGLSIMPRLLERFPGLPVLIISGYSDLKLVEKALSFGARGYLSKHSSLEDVDDAIKRIAAGERVLHDEILAEMLSAYVGRPDANINKVLNDEEISILRLCGEGKTYREISRTLFISERTLYRKLSVICEKLNVSNKMQAVSAALKKGLLQGLVSTASTVYCLSLLS